MKSLHAVLAAILMAGSTYCSTSAPSIISHTEGESFTAVIVTFDDVIEKCYLVTPAKEIVEFKPVDTSGDRYEFMDDNNILRCRVLISDLTPTDKGIWTLHSEAASGVNRAQSYNLTVNALATTEPTTTEPTTTTTVPVQTEILPAEIFNSTLGSNHTVVINDYGFVTSERCILVTPEGERIDLMEVNRPEMVQVIANALAPCSVRILVNSEDAAGEWVLISEGTRLSSAIERRQPFTIHVEETVDASVDEVTLAEGNDFYIRLKNSIPYYDTCRLIGPNENRDVEIDQRFVDSCGFVVKDVTTYDTGTWEIRYLNRISYRARVALHVNGDSARELDPLAWSRDSALNATVGPDNAVYCKLENPSGMTVFDGFGRCRVIIDRVTMDHDGVWKMTIGVPGGVFTEKYKVEVSVIKRAHDTPVVTSVGYNKPVVTITCIATSQFPVLSCKFRNPRGEVLLATEGVGQGRYSFHGNGTSFNNGLYTHECGFQITDPTVQEQGFWRCALETEEANHYGFLRVLSPWLMRDPEVVAGIVREPVLWSAGARGVSGARAALRCGAPAALRYCYFRARNGTVFNVQPASPNYEGGGFPSGECGIRFDSLLVTDSGSWSCHIGIEEGGSLVELMSSFNVTIHAQLSVSQWVRGDTLFLEARLPHPTQLEYCRFVRIDGFGFTSISLPRYTLTSDLSGGKCGLTVEHPSILERHPWTLVARPAGGDEVMGTTTHTIEMPTPIRRRYFNFPVIIIITLGITLIIFAGLIAPKRNRRWAFERASALRNSFRKMPPPDSAQNTASAA